MPEPTPMTDQDAEHVRLLSVFHYVLAGIAGLVSLIPLIHLFIGIGIVSGSFDVDDATPIAFGWLFIVVPVLIIFMGLTYSVCLVLAGSYLNHYRRYTFCLVIAALSCMFTPFGTVLGVFTIIVLMRPAVRARFQAG